MKNSLRNSGEALTLSPGSPTEPGGPEEPGGPVGPLKRREKQSQTFLLQTFFSQSLTYNLTNNAGH